MIISILLLVVAAFSKAVMDRSSEGDLQFSPRNYWIKNLGSSRKWKWSPSGVVDPSTGIEEYIIEGEAFPGSSTIFAFLTDGWHLAQFVFLACVFTLIVTYQIHYSTIIDFVILRVVFGIAFEGFYRMLKRN